MQTLDAPYDIVGRYDQDEINGFSEALLTRFLEICRIETAGQILDAMAGDGNLSLRLFRFCQSRGIPLPGVTVLEYSEVQSRFAAAALQDYPARVFCGDILQADNILSLQSPFDRVMIKSANHEIPFRQQAQLYRTIFNVLAPNGLFVNLGFLFDDEKERDELREIARAKDSLAGLEMAVRNRHFLTRKEFYHELRRAGFVDIEAAHAFNYQIRSAIVAKRYFHTEIVEQESIAFQMAQLKALTMRRNGKIRFEADGSVMECPGEITLARRPTKTEETQAIYQRYPYDFLRHIKVHRELLSCACEFISQGARVLDAGCGIGLLAERTAAQASRYLAVDINPEFVEICRNRMRRHPHVEVVLGDLNHLCLDPGAFDCALALNVLYQEGIRPEGVLEMLRDALRPGGLLVISAPKSAESFEKCEARMLQDLEQEGALSGKDEIAAQIRAANEKLLTSNAHYWSAQEMAEMLLRLRFSRIVKIDDSLYYGNAWLLAAER